MSAPPSELFGAIFRSSAVGGDLVKESEAEHKPVFGAVMREMCDLDVCTYACMPLPRYVCVCKS